MTLKDWIAPARTALLLVDCQVDFADPEGVLGRQGIEVLRSPPIAGRGGIGLEVVSPEDQIDGRIVAKSPTAIVESRRLAVERREHNRGDDPGLQSFRPQAEGSAACAAGLAGRPTDYLRGSAGRRGGRV